ncbi:proline-rich protein 2-like [Pyrgilauda ruficollis]|uniref:proline-rich protein 2-like n=1 Tax=Pyrgilauda ruficollis TaxID=221976 RepID=UPI001B8698F6|nr:proline-rich protein 2-like [Pyrgilauda ruficollis]
MLPPRSHTSPKPWGQQFGRFPAPPVPERLAALEGRPLGLSAVRGYRERLARYSPGSAPATPSPAPRHGIGSGAPQPRLHLAPARRGSSRPRKVLQGSGKPAWAALPARPLPPCLESPACQPPAPCLESPARQISAPCLPAPCPPPGEAPPPRPQRRSAPGPVPPRWLRRLPAPAQPGPGGASPAAQGARVPTGARTEARSCECPPPAAGPPPQRHAHPPPPRGRSVPQSSEPIRAEPCRAQAVPARTGPRRSRPFMEGGPEHGPGGAERRGPRPARPPKGLFPPAALRGKEGKKAAPQALPAGAPPGLPRGCTACSGSGMGMKPEGAGHPGTVAAGFATETSVRG